MTQAKPQKALEASLEGPRVEKTGSFLVAGLRRHYTDNRISNIPAQWQHFVSYLGRIPGQVGRTTYGVCLSPTGGVPGIDYLSGVEVSGSLGLPDEFSVVTIRAQPYAVFVHRGHASQLRDSLDSIWEKRLPESGHRLSAPLTDSPAFFERYTEKFDPRTATGDVELWIPIAL